MKKKKHSPVYDLFLKMQINWIVIALYLLVIVILISHFFYVIRTHQYPMEDEGVYLQRAVEIVPLLKHPTFETWAKIIETVKHRQPLYSVSISIPLLVFGTSSAYKIGLFLNGLFYGTTILVTYLIGKEFFNKKNAFLAALIFAFYGFPLFYLHFLYEETAATTFVVLSLFFLVKSKNFKETKHIIFCAIFLAIGFLFRWLTPIFLAGPLLLSLILGLQNGLQRKNVIKNLFLFLAVFIIPSLLLYYLPQATNFSGYFHVNLSQGSAWASPSLKSPFSPSSLIWYANVLAQQTIFFWLLFLAGFILSMRNSRWRLLAIGFAVPYLILTLGSAWKQDRFIVPAYPLMALLSVSVLESVNKQRAVVLLSSLIIIVGVLNFIGASWGLGPMGSIGLRSFLLPMPLGHPRRIYLSPIVWPPRENEGNSDKIIKTILSTHKGKNPNILLTFYVPQIEGPMYTKILYEEQSLFTLIPLFGQDRQYTSLFSKLARADFILYKTGRHFDQLDENSYLIDIFNRALEQPKKNILPAYNTISVIPIPIDGSTLTITRRTRELTAKDYELLGNALLKVDPKASNEILQAISTSR